MSFNQLRDKLDEQKNRTSNIQKEKKPSGHGDGKWQNNNTISNYRKKRNGKNKKQRAARKRNR